MQLILNGTTHTFAGEAQEIPKVLETIDAYCEQHGLIVSHALINGEEVYGEMEQVLQELDKIETFEAVLVTKEDLLKDSLQNANLYLEESALPALQKLAERFTGTVTESDWEQFQQLLESIAWMVDFNRLLQANSGAHHANDLQELEARLSGVLQDMESAVSNQDMVLLSDLLQYELAPVYERMNGKVKQILKEQEVEGP